MKLLILLFPSVLFSQIKLSADADLTFDYYRGMGVSFVTSVITEKITHNQFLSGTIGFATGCAQGLILERGSSGKIVSCMGSCGGTFVYIIRCDIKYKKEQRKLDRLKGKL